MHSPPDQQQATIEPEVLAALGASTDVPIWGPNLHNEVANRWSSFIQNGLDKDKRLEIQQKYRIPENMKNLASPKLNGEILSFISETGRKQDNFLCRLQDQMSSALAALGDVLGQIIDHPESLDIKTNILPKLADSGAIFTDLHHAISIHRKYLIAPSINFDCKKAMESSPIDEYLFGSEFHNKIKEIQTMKKVGEEIKVKPRKILKGSSARWPSSSATKSNNLNYQRRFNRTKKKPGQDQERRKEKKRTYQRRRQ